MDIKCTPAELAELLDFDFGTNGHVAATVELAKGRDLRDEVERLVVTAGPGGIVVDTLRRALEKFDGE